MAKFAMAITDNPGIATDYSAREHHFLALWERLPGPGISVVSQVLERLWEEYSEKPLQPSLAQNSLRISEACCSTALCARLAHASAGL
jgi:hypothetical protein